MPRIGINCLLKNTDLIEKIKQLIPILNMEVGAKNGAPTFRQVYNELVKTTGTEIDLDSFAEMYKSEIPKDLRYTTDEEIEDIINRRTKQALGKLSTGAIDRLDGIGETSPERSVIHKIAGILNTLQGNNLGKKIKTISKTIQDAVISEINRLANSNPAYKELKQKDSKETFDQTLERVLTTNSESIATMEADKFNTVQDLFDKAKQVAIGKMKDLRDEDGEPILGEEALNFLEQYKNSVFGVMMSTGDATTLIRGALLEAGYGKGEAGKQVVDWKELAGSINSPAVLRENVIKVLQEGKGLSVEAATSIADSLSNEFKELVRGEKAMNVKYAIAESEAENILSKLGWKPTNELTDKINSELHDAIDASVDESDTLYISKIVNDVLIANSVTEQQLANLPARGIILESHTADRIAKLVKDDGELDGDALANLYKILGKSVDDAAIEDLRRLAKLKEQVMNIEIRVDGSEDGTTGKLTATKQGIEKIRLIKTISDQMARVVAKSVDYSGRNFFQKFFIKAMNVGSKYISANAALVLLNPFNLTQNILSGSFAGTQGKVGGAVSGLFGAIKTPLTYTTPTGEKINLSELLNTAGRFDTWWNTLIGAEGRDIPDLFTGDASKDAKTFQNSQSKGEFIEAGLTALPRAALTAADSMLKEPYFRKELIRGVLYHLQASGGKTKQQAQDLVYEALTGNSVANLTRQAKDLATMVGKGADKFYVKQVAEDIQIASLVMHDDDGRSILSEQHLQSIIDAAKQTSGEVFGHRIQKDVVGLGWVYDVFSGARAKASEGINKEFGERMAEHYKRGQYEKAAWLHFTHSLKNTVGFLFQRGIYNWAILMAQKNPLSILTGFRQLRRDVSFNTEENSRESVANYLRARAKIGRGIMGTATAMAIVPLVMAALGDDPEERKKKLAALRKDPVWGRVFNNFVSPFAQAYIDGSLSDNAPEGIATGFRDMLIKPVVSAGSKYYSVDNLLISSIDQFEKGQLPKGSAIVGGILGSFLPGKSFMSTNRAWVERAGKDSPSMVDENFQIVIDSKKPPKPDDFWDAFWYSSLFKEKKK